MSDPNELENLRQAHADWEANTLRKALARAPERQDEFFTTSSAPVERLGEEDARPEREHYRRSQDLGDAVPVPHEAPWN